MLSERFPPFIPHFIPSIAVVHRPYNPVHDVILSIFYPFSVLGLTTPSFINLFLLFVFARASRKGGYEHRGLAPHGEGEETWNKVFTLVSNIPGFYVEKRATMLDQ